jgi:hypothetical protein
MALAGNTVYTVTLSGTITDAAGTALGSDITWSFTTGAATWDQNASSGFSAGTTSSTMVTSSGIQLAAAFSEDFNGTSLSSAWTSTATGGGTANLSVSSGILTVLATEVDSVQTYSNVPVEGYINFGAAPYQHFGLATGLGSLFGNYWALFSTAGTTNTLYARVNVNGTTTDVNLGTLPSGFHDYLIEPVAAGFQFFVDGVSQTTITASFPGGTALKIVLSDYTGTAANPLKADWVRITAYPSSGTFTSSVFDATRAATWGVASWTANIPAGTTITVQTRSGNTATPDGTWSSWAAVVNGGTVASPSGRYLQYRIIITSTDPGFTPLVTDINFQWT